MKSFALFLITFYQMFASAIIVQIFGKSCKHDVSCSEYAKIKISKHGLSRGLSLAIRRLLSCQSFANPNFGFKM